MDNIYEIIEKYNPNKKRKILIVFDDMTADMLSNNKPYSIPTESFITERKLNISLVFLKQSYVAVAINTRLNSTYCFATKISNKRELQQIAFNHSSDINFQDFINPYKNCIAKLYIVWLLVLLLHQKNLSRFRNNTLERI